MMSRSMWGKENRVTWFPSFKKACRSSSPSISEPITKGSICNFLTKAKWRPLVNPSPGSPTHVEIWNTEEKGSDVNLATYLIHDAWRDLFDVAVVLSQDTDLNEPVRILRDEMKKDVGVVCLDGKAPGKVASHASFVRHVTDSRLAVAHFPALAFGKRGKTVTRPVEWS